MKNKSGFRQTLLSENNTTLRRSYVSGIVKRVNGTCIKTTGCGKIKDPTTKTAISLKRRNNLKWKFPRLMRT